MAVVRTAAPSRWISPRSLRCTTASAATTVPVPSSTGAAADCEPSVISSRA